MERWKGKIAIVTGASSGIGEAIAKILADNGIKVIALARSTDKLKSLTTYNKNLIKPLPCDVTNEDDIIRVINITRSLHGGVDILVNNAGVMPMCPLNGFSTKDLKQMFDTNVIGLCIFTREIIKDMQNRGVNDGHIINISSVAGQRILDFPGLYPYAATKHAVRVITEGLRRELRDLGTKIRVTSISPGYVQTNLLNVSGIPNEIIKQIESENPKLQSSDIAEAVVFALSRPPNVQIHELTVQPVGEAK